LRSTHPFFISKHLRWSVALSSCLRLLIFSIPFSLAIVHILKSGLARYRPKQFFSQALYGFDLQSSFSHNCSFPSGHACIIGAIVGALACSYPKYTWHLLALGIILSMSRVLALDHYLSDILAGITIGAMTSQALFIFMKNYEPKI
jgi:undecaprenyl-diphosphatase